MNMKEEHQNKIKESGFLSENIERNAQYWYKYRKPATDSSWFDHWVNRIFGLDCILVCNSNDLSLLSKLNKEPFSE